MTQEVLLDVRSMRVDYAVGQGRSLRAVDSVDLQVRRGRALGLVGESGCGKSTLGLGLMRLLPPSAGLSFSSIKLVDKDISSWNAERFRKEIRWKRISMIYQAAMTSLNPVFRVGDQLVAAFRLHHPEASLDQARERANDLFEMVGIPKERFRGYPHEYSGGMQQRAVIALSLVADPDLVIADEATTALDVVVQNQILDALNDLRDDLGLAMIVISHDIGAVASTCDEIAVMYAGQLVELGPVAEVLNEPRHPYTAALMGALPSLYGERRRLVTLEGTPPDLTVPETLCRFRDRCPVSEAICFEVEPPYVPTSQRPARCHFAGSEKVSRVAAPRIEA